MDLVYSRDAQAPLLLVVEKVLKEVREGIFRPDETRSGRLVSSDAKPLAGSFVPGLGEASAVEGSPVHEQVPATCKVEVASAEATDAAIISISDSEASDSLGEPSEESDEDFGQPIAFVARGQVIPSWIRFVETQFFTSGSLGAKGKFQTCLPVVAPWDPSSLRGMNRNSGLRIFHVSFASVADRSRK